jgi:phage gp29-like protein
MSDSDFEKKSQAQKQSLYDAYTLIDNLRSAIMHLHKADFRGYAHLQKHRNADGEVYHLETLDQWCICRDGLNGNWFWNPDSRSTSAPLQFLGLKYCIGGPMLPLSDFIIREMSRPIDEIGLVNTVRRAMVEKDYDAFIEIYGIPGGVVIMPPAVPVGKEQEYQDTAQKVAEGASGALPHGSDFKTNTLPRSQDPFTPRLENLDAALVLAGTGGKLTMLTEHTAGQQRGNSRVHDETFGQIAAGRAQNISEHFQRNFDQEILANKHPGEPTLAYFSFGGEEETDVDALCTNVLSLSQAGKNVNTAWLEEKTGYEFDEDDQGDPAIEEVPPADGDETEETNEPPNALPSSVRNRLAAIADLTDPELQRECLVELAENIPALKRVFNAGGGDQPRDSLGRWVDENGGGLSTKDNLQRGTKAMDRAIRKKADVQKAMYRRGIGQIDFRWGTPGNASNDFKGGFGISHVIAKHGEKSARALPLVLAKGKISPHVEGPDKMLMEYQGRIASLARENKTKSWVITSFERQAGR